MDSIFRNMIYAAATAKQAIYGIQKKRRLIRDDTRYDMELASQWTKPIIVIRK